MNAQVIRNTVDEKQLTCVEVRDDNYIIYRNDGGHAFSLYMKNDYCNLLHIKSQETQQNLTANVHIEIDGRLIDLGMDETNAIKFPITVSHEKDNPKVMIIELDMVNFISTRGYTYLIIDLRDGNAIRYAEFSERLPVKDLQPEFKKYKESKYLSTTINRS